MLDRQTIIDGLHSVLEGEEDVRAAWLGGSDATGRTDAYSDIDFQVIVERADVERAFEHLHAALEELGAIELAYRLPSPTWHGFEQEFLRVAGSDPQHFVDFVAMASDTRPVPAPSSSTGPPDRTASST